MHGMQTVVSEVDFVTCEVFGLQINASEVEEIQDLRYALVAKIIASADFPGSNGKAVFGADTLLLHFFMSFFLRGSEAYCHLQIRSTV